MADEARAALSIIIGLVAGDDGLISRLAAPLWARVGRPLVLGDLSWARPLLGNNGPEILLRALAVVGAIDTSTSVITARGLARFISTLVGDNSPRLTSQESIVKTVWTLPRSHPACSVRGRSYLETSLNLINQSTKALALVSPYLDPGGIGTLLSPILAALNRGVSVKLFAHDALNIGTKTSYALEQLRTEASRLRVRLSVYSAEAGNGKDRIDNPLFHAKLIICDGTKVLIGSANLTSFALGSNFEAGVLLGEPAAREALFMIDGMIQSNTVYLVFQTA
jgi:cardiolipin synthase